jgi:hypothetical protein
MLERATNIELPLGEQLERLEPTTFNWVLSTDQSPIVLRIICDCVNPLFECGSLLIECKDAHQLDPRRDFMSGNELINTLISLTGLPEDFARQELLNLLQARNLSAENLSLDELRDVLADLLQNIVLAQ